MTELLSLSGLLLLVWLAYEPLYQWKGKGHRTWRIAGWLLRPWTVWAAVNLVYRLHRAGRFGHLETAPSFYKGIFPLFASFWAPKETLPETMMRLAVTPPAWAWGAVVLMLTGFLVIITRRILSPGKPTAGRGWAVLSGLYVLCVVQHMTIACLPNGAWSTEKREGSLLSCWTAHSTMLYSVQFVKSKSQFLHHFHEEHPNLRRTIHGMSHPPGATLSMYALGNLAGAGGKNIRLDSTRIRYAVALTMFGALNVFVLYCLGRGLFSDPRIGLTAALLWMTAPAMMIYSGFAQDILYAVFFNLALLFTWRTGTAERTPWLQMVLLGLVFFALNWLTYAWCVATLLFALFMLYCRRAHAWTFREAAVRAVAPLALMTVLSAAMLHHYDLDYLRMYKVSSDYVREWYRFETVYHHLIAWVGGQVELWVLMGAVSVSAFCTSVLTTSRKDLPRPQLVFLLLVLAVFALPVIVGPTALRLETARCWGWILSVPMCFAAREMLGQDRPDAFVLSAVVSSVLIYTVMRLFVTFA